MWHAMPPQNNMLHAEASSSSSAPRPPDPERVNVHHFQHGSAPAAAPPMMGVPYPYPMPSPAPQMYPYPAYPPPPPPSCHGHCHNQYPMHQQQQQPQFVVYQQDKENAPPNVNKQDEKKPEEKKPEPPKEQEQKPDEEKATQSKNQPPPPPPEKKAQTFSKFSVASIIIFALALIFGTVCTVKTYQANDERIDGYEAGITDTVSDNKVYQHTRKLALGMGCTSAICFTIATLCSFYAGLRHNSYAARHNRPRPKEHCCLAGFVISGWIIFCLTFINNLIIAVLAFDSNNTIYPEVVFVGFMGSLCSWVLMFGYSELARRAG